MCTEIGSTGLVAWTGSTLLQIVQCAARPHFIGVFYMFPRNALLQSLQLLSHKEVLAWPLTGLRLRLILQVHAYLSILFSITSNRSLCWNGLGRSTSAVSRQVIVRCLHLIYFYSCFFRSSFAGIPEVSSLVWYLCHFVWPAAALFLSYDMRTYTWAQLDICSTDFWPAI